METRKSLMRMLPTTALALAVLCLLPSGCGQKQAQAAGEAHPLEDTLMVATIYGPASFFSYRDTLMGYDYEYMEAIAGSHGKPVHWVVANTLEEAIELSQKGMVDLVAAPIPEQDFRGALKGSMIPCGPEMRVDEVLVQPPGDTLLVNVNQLVGRTVSVEKGSRSEKSLQAVNKKLGGGIHIVPVDPDTLAIEDMLASTARGEGGMVATDRETARLNKTYYPDLKITLSLSEPEKTRWGVWAERPWIADTINAWCSGAKPAQVRSDLINKYLDAQKYAPVAGASYDRKLENGYASPFDHLYKAHSENSRWDWRLLAAQGYTESRFDSTARSWAGAEGVMQIMPGTARDFGLAKSEMKSADKSIETAVKILNKYDAMLAQKVPDEEERSKFALAAYNAGPGHVMDAIKLAEKYGLDPNKWDDNVEKAMLMKMNRKYYRDPVVKYGYSRGRETVDYVERIYDYYDQARAKIPKGDNFTPVTLMQQPS